MRHQARQGATSYAVGAVGLHARRHRGDRERDRDDQAEDEQTEGVGQDRRQRDPAGEVHPRELVLVGVERRRPEEHRHHGQQPRSRTDRRDVRERAPHHQPVAVAAPEGELGDQARVHLERVGASEPHVAEDGGTDQHHREVRRQPQPHRAQVGALRVDQLLPDEGEQADRGGPVPQPRGVRREPARGVTSGRLRQQQVERAHRADRAYDGPEEQRERHDPDPHQHVEGAEHGVGDQVGAGDQRPEHVAEEQQPQDADRPREDGPSRPSPRSSAARGGLRRAPGGAAYARPARARRTTRSARPRQRRRRGRAGSGGPWRRRSRAGAAP